MLSTTTFSVSGGESHHIVRAAMFLREDKLVAFPTETVYGLGGNALSDSAVAAIYEAKGRPRFNPLIVHVASQAEAERYVVFDDRAKKLAAHFWPGALTMILPRRKDCTLSLLVSAGLDTVAMRVPAHPVAQALLGEARLPVAAPSANRSGQVSPTEAAHVQEELGHKAAMVLDGDACPVGIESTVVDLTVNPPTVLRPGSVTVEELERIVGKVKSRGDAASGFKSPGMLEKHYAPRTPLRLGAREVRESEALLAFGVPLPGRTAATENLSPRRDLKEAAANLFRMLRKLDASGASGIAAMPIPEEGLGIAINDRLRRAATY